MQIFNYDEVMDRVCIVGLVFIDTVSSYIHLPRAQSAKLIEPIYLTVIVEQIFHGFLLSTPPPLSIPLGFVLWDCIREACPKV